MKNDKYYSLVPKPIEKVDEYIDMLDFGIKDENCTNIAISGPYGSGKSSIIKTYIQNKRIKEDKFISISLANFNQIDNAKLNVSKSSSSDNDSTLEDDLNKTDLNISLLERKILKHLFYTNKANKFPNSRFSRITKLLNKWKILTIYSLVTIITLITIDFIMEIDIFNIIENSIFLSALYLFSIIFILYLLMFVVLKNYTLKKVDAKFISFDINLNTGEDVFEKYIDEIIYFFQQTKYELIIIEDLDRFDTLEIFSNLREMNIILNNSNEIKRKITFLYAMNDYLIENENIINNRTKFFDFIIPIIPFITTSNSDEVFIEFFKESQNEMPSKKFIEESSLYIGDYRLLKNIYNEYILYFKRLNNEKITISEKYKDKLMAVIIYKNFMPKDFEDLRKSNGKLYDCLTTIKNEIRISLSLEINREINKLEKKLSFLDDFVLLDQHFYDNYISFTLYKKFNSLSIYYTPYQHSRGNRVDIKDKNSKDLYELLKDKYVSNNTNVQNILFNDLIIGFDYSSYNSKVEIDNIKTDIKNKLPLLYKNKTNLDNMMLFDLYSKLNVEEKKLYKAKFGLKKIVEFLLVGGYLNENYNDYINYYHKGSYNDLQFLRKLKNNEELNYNFDIQNISYIYQRMYLNDWDNVTVLNYKLLKYLIENNLEYNMMYLINSSFNNSKLDFIVNFINKNTEIDLVVNKLSNINKAFEKIISSNNIEGKNKDDFVSKVLSSKFDITNFNQNKELTNYINSYKDFITNINYLPKNKISTIENNILKLNVKFRILTFNHDQHDFFKFVYERNLYFMNKYMIELVFKKIFNKECSEEHVCSYSKINEFRDSLLLEYINENITEYIENCMLLSTLKITEDYEAVTRLLNDDIDNELLVKVIKKNNISFIIEEINKVDKKELWYELVLNNRVSWSIDNVIEFFYSNQNYREELFELIEKKDILNKIKLHDPLSNTTVNELDKDLNEFIDYIFKCNKLSVITVGQLLKIIGSGKIALENFKEIPSERLNEIIKLDLLTFQEDIYYYIGYDNNNLVYDYIFHNLECYTNQIGQHLTHDEINELLTSILIEIKDYGVMNTILNALDSIIRKYTDEFDLSKDLSLSVSSHKIKLLIKKIDNDYIKLLLIYKNRKLFDDKTLIYLVSGINENCKSLVREWKSKKRPQIKLSIRNDILLRLLKARQFISFTKLSTGYQTYSKAKIWDIESQEPELITDK